MIDSVNKLIKTILAIIGVLALPTTIVFAAWYGRGPTFAGCVTALWLITGAFVCGFVWLSRHYGSSK